MMQLEKYFLALSNPRAKYNGKDLEMIIIL